MKSEKWFFLLLVNIFNDLILQLRVIGSIWLYIFNGKWELSKFKRALLSYFVLHYILWFLVSLPKQSYHFWLTLSNVVGICLIAEKLLDFFSPFSLFIYHTFSDNGLRREFSITNLLFVLIYMGFYSLSL